MRLVESIPESAVCGARCARAKHEGGQFTMTLEEARKFVIDHRKDLPGGVICPCCDQRVKIYSRKLNSGMAYALIAIYRYFKQPNAERWLHVPTYKSLARLGGDVAKLCYWGLLERMPGKRADGSTHQGFFRITPYGCAFVEKKAKAWSHMFVTNQKLVGYDKETVMITDALGDKFDYTQLMITSCDV